MQKEVYEFISQQTNDPIIERKICKISGKEFAIFQKDIDFYAKISPTFAGEKIQVPRPTLCSEERWKRRLLFKNERTLFRNTCALTGKSVISIHAPDSGFKIYSVKAWRGDARDPMDYGREYDSSRSFFDQYKDLHISVPQIAMMNDHGTHSENIEYCQDVAYAKNCYLTTVAWKLEHAYYSSNMAGGNWLVDCFFSMASENCYECCDSNHLYGCSRVQYAFNCQNCWFGYDLAGCKDCIGCVNLREKQYCYFNQQLTKEAYLLKKEEFVQQLNQDPEYIKKQFTEFLMQYPRRPVYNTNATNTYGSNLYNAENSMMCYNIQNIKDTRYCMFGDTMTDAMDLTVGGELELCYEGVTPDHSYHACFSVMCRSCTNVRYSDMCHHCQDCFGCIGLRNKQYCIFNTQYTKEIYEQKVLEIIHAMQKSGERGEFFPTFVAPYAYNVSTIMDYFPLSKQEALAQRYHRRDQKEEINISENIQLVQARDLPRLAKDVSDDIINQAVVCEISGRPFRILQPELDFYRRLNIPFPRKHPEVRYEERLKRMPSKQLYARKCDKTGEQILSVYPQDVPFKVYSEKAFNEEVY